MPRVYASVYSRSQRDVHWHQVSTAGVVVNRRIVPVRSLGQELDDVDVGKPPVLIHQLSHGMVNFGLFKAPRSKAQIVGVTAWKTRGVAAFTDHQLVRMLCGLPTDRIFTVKADHDGPDMLDVRRTYLERDDETKAFETRSRFLATHPRESTR